MKNHTRQIKEERKRPMRLFLILFILFCSSPSFAQFRTVTINVNMQRPLFAADCLKCHGSAINGMKYANSVHGPNACSSCHVDIIDFEKHTKKIYIPAKVDCSPCHQREAKEYLGSVHHTKSRFDCIECHSDIHYLGKWDRSKVAIINKCTSCHSMEDYVESGHDKAILKGNQDSAVCSDCHGLHDTRLFHALGRGYSLEAREFYTKACFKCHGDSALMKKSNLTTIAVETYEETLHGKIRKLGVPSAGCADCHGAHNILPKEDPKSSIHEENLKKICSNCHQGVSVNFTKYIAHPNLSNRERYPLLFWTKVFMFILLLSILVFYWGHTFLWWRKAYWEKQRQLREGILISERLVHIENPGETYIRFKLRDRIFHLICIFTFFGLAFTGLPIKFPDAQWAQFMLNFIGGAEGAILLHRILAFIILVEFFIFLVYCAHFALFNKKRGKTIRERLFGPYSFLPRKKDWEDFVAMGKWFVDQGPPPEFDHWTYYEKFDVLAVFWGMVAIGISGVLLWLPEVTAKFIPGWVINIARIIHSEEALLAIGFIFTVHFFNTHFVPTKWPMNYSIFTGRIYKWEFIEERSLEYDRLLESKELEKLKVAFPNVLGNLLSGVVGIASLILGLLTLVFIVWAVVY